MSEKSEQTKKKLAQNADKITIAVLALILLGLGYMWFKEQNSGLGTADTNGKPATFQDTLADSPTLKMLQTMSTAPSIANDPDSQRLAQWSMFDNSTMQQEQAAESQAIQQVASAEQLIKDGKPEQARPLLEQVVRIARYNKQAVELLDKITTPTAAGPATGMTGAGVDASGNPI